MPILAPVTPIAPLGDPYEAEGAAKGGAPEAVERPTFARLYGDQFALVWRNVRRMGVGEESIDDVVQEVFVAAYKRLPSFEGRSSIRSWLIGITILCVQRHRRTIRRKAPHTCSADLKADPETLSDLSTNPHEMAARAEAARVVIELLEQLDDKKRAVFVLAELERLSASEIAYALGVGVNTVYSRLRLARQEFAEAAARHRARDHWRNR